MKATVLRQGDYGEVEVEEAGHFVSRQNPITYEIERVWVPVDSDDATPDLQVYTFPLVARAIIDGGIRVAGTTERFLPSGVIESADYVRIQFPASVELSKRDRVYNIKNRDGIVLWKEEEYNGRPTVFEVLGVSPVTDPFGKLVEQHALLQRAEVQDGPR
jgi:hypothetical protein